jgi:hypothetical protein
MRWIRHILIGLLTAAVCLPGLQAQDLEYRIPWQGSWEGGLGFQAWKAGDDRIRSFSLPISFLYPVREGMSLFFMTSPASTRLESPGTYSLEGFSDVQFGGHALILNEQVLLTFGLNLPTGKSRLSSEQYTVATILSQPALGFRTPSLGQGLDYSVGLSHAREMGSWSIGGGVRYMGRGRYQPFEEMDFYYDPGEEVTMTFGLHRGPVTADLLYTLYSSDKWDGEKVFQSGNRITLQLLARFRPDPVELVFLIRDRLKAKNRIGSGSVLETEGKNRNGNQLEIQGAALYPVGERTRIKGLLELKAYSNNDYGYGAATLLGVGAGLSRQVTGRLFLRIDGTFYFGTLNTGLENQSTNGVHVYGGFRYVIK